MPDTLSEPPVDSMTDDALLAEYNASEAEADDPRQTALATEIWRRNLDL